MTYIIYTDGGLRKKPPHGRWGAWSYCIVEAPPSSIGVDYRGRASGKIVAYDFGRFKDPVSSGHSELMAVIEALKFVIKRDEYRKTSMSLVSDSTYVTGGLNKPHVRAKANEAHAHLWMELLPLSLFMDIETHHVKGHSGQTFNAFCDWACDKCLEQLDHPAWDHTYAIHRAVRLINESKPYRVALLGTHR